jgi:LmbE family N-acetylglucosaminyl deacetylase
VGPHPPGRPAPPCAALRRHELVASLAVAGVHDHRWLGFRDGECASVPAASQTAPLVQELGADEFGRWWAAEAFVAAARVPAPSMSSGAPAPETVR